MDGMLITIVGLMAAGSNLAFLHPQVRKALPAGSTHDLSSKTLAVLAAGLPYGSGTGSSKAIT